MASRSCPGRCGNESGVRLTFASRGSQTSVTRSAEPSGRTLEASTISLDDFAADRGIERIDYIKLDVEGAELKALRGAEGVLRTFRPTLAVAAYHSESDLIEIPSYLASLDLGYEFYLDHFSAGIPETVLFAGAAEARR